MGGRITQVSDPVDEPAGPARARGRGTDQLEAPVEGGHSLWRTLWGRGGRTAQLRDERPVNPFAIGGGFLEFCLRKGWLVQRGSGREARYFVTPEGRHELRQFDILLD